MNERIEKGENPHTRNSGHNHRPQTQNRSRMMECLQKGRRFPFHQQNKRIQELIILAHVK